MSNISKFFEETGISGCRYSSDFAELIEKMGDAEKILKERHEADYQGFADVDVLLLDGRVVSYTWSFGSCSGCDGWEAAMENLPYDDERRRDFVLLDMEKEITIFKSLETYIEWRETINVEAKLTRWEK